MKHIIAVVLAVALALVAIPSVAENNYLGMTYEQLLAEQNALSVALRAVEPINGDLIYEKDGIRVSYNGIVKSYSPAIQFVVENASDVDISLTIEDMAVNDFMTTGLFFCDVLSGKKAIDKMDLLYLDDYGIETVTKIDLKLRIINKDTYKTIASSDMITIIP